MIFFTITTTHIFKKKYVITALNVTTIKTKIKKHNFICKRSNTLGRTSVKFSNVAFSSLYYKSKAATSAECIILNDLTA